MFQEVGGAAEDDLLGGRPPQAPARGRGAVVCGDEVVGVGRGWDVRGVGRGWYVRGVGRGW